ncbi:hypothetical protein Cgig2_030622 [Carnegiea gigantea]|uniref:Uncharacterized protein n=1 Tax=Carnegiea gigantea TaxID=171969 RepID=A0A9Q1K8G2_9CARY|nr:hypothetical protein Cgig2_030622 [Carnegiea gigantea]
MMIKNFISSASRTTLNASSTHHGQLINTVMMGACCLSSQGIHHNSGTPIARPDHQPGQTTAQDDNKIDAPFTGTEPKAKISLNEESYNNDDRARGDQKSRTEEMTDYVADKAKRGTKSAVETAFDVGAAMAEGMEHTWGGVKQTTHKVKDAILGKGDQDDKDPGPKRDDDHKVDKHVEDLRRKARGYDVGSN